MDKILDVAGDLTAGRPRKKRILQVYSSRFYATKIKAGFDAHWAKEKGALPASERVSLMADWVRNSWEAETPEFRKAFTEEFDAEYQAAVKGYKEGKAFMPGSAEARAE
jgi:hypothetical protein